MALLFLALEVKNSRVIFIDDTFFVGANYRSWWFGRWTNWRYGCRASIK